MNRRKSGVSALKAPFVVTVAIGAIAGCGGTTSNADDPSETTNTDGGLPDARAPRIDRKSPVPKPMCPASPQDGAACEYSGDGCPAYRQCYSSSVPVTARCVGGRWQLGPIGCNPPPPPCPIAMPEIGSACSYVFAAPYCTYATRCGGTVGVTCRGSRWDFSSTTADERGGIDPACLMPPIPDGGPVPTDAAVAPDASPLPDGAVPEDGP
jgi:hypothetical protein